MTRVNALLAAALGLAMLLSAHPGPAQAEYRTIDAQRISNYRGAVAAYEKALKLMDKKDLDGALDALVVSVQAMPDFPDSHFLMARILYSEKEFTRSLGEMVLAREGFERTADLRESMLKDRRRALSDRIRQKDVAISEQTSRMATVSPEQRQKIQMVIDRLQLERQDLLRLVQESSQAPTLVPARYSCLHGNILLRLDRDPEAIAQYEEALKTDPGYGEAANNLASLYHVSGQNRKAMEIVTEAQKRGAKLHPELAKSIEAALARNP